MQADLDLKINEFLLTRLKALNKTGRRARSPEHSRKSVKMCHKIEKKRKKKENNSNGDGKKC